MGRTRRRKANPRMERYERCLDYHRAIHRSLDDGALLAICETYGDEGAADGGIEVVRKTDLPTTKD